MRDFNDLTKGILSAPINNARMQNVSDGTYGIKIDGDKVYLSAKKKAPIAVTDNGFAAMRIVADKADVAGLVTTKDARESGKVYNLQSALQQEIVKELSAKTKFNCDHRVQILDAATGTVIFNNECYNGYPTYLKGARTAARLEGTERQDAFAKLSETLRESGVKTTVSQTDVKNIQHMPVFTVTE